MKEAKDKLSTTEGLENQVRILSEQMPAILWTTDGELIITSSVGKGLEGLGLKPNQLNGTPLSDYLKSTDPEFLPLAAHLRALRGETVTYDQEWEKKYFHSHIEPLRDPSGNIVGTIGMALDITDLKMIQADYEKSISMQQATLESTADGILVVDSAGKMLGFNRKFAQMWRIPELVLQSRDDERALTYVLNQLKDPEKFLQKVQYLYSHPGADSFDILEFKDERVFERFSQPQKVGEKIVGRVWSFRDVTDRVKAEHSLRDRTERALRYQAGLLELAKLEMNELDTALEKILEIDAKILEVERVSIWLFDADRSRIECQKLFHLGEKRFEEGQVLRAKDYPAYFRALEESRILPASHAAEDTRTREFSENYLKPNRISSMMDVPFRLGGKVVGILCHEHIGPSREWSLEDQEFASSVADLISLAYTGAERRKAELALQEKSEELERSNRELAQFAYVASHDLQEPLHLIIAFSDRMEGSFQESLGEKGLDYLKRMKRSAQRMRQLIDDLLQFSRVTTRAKPFVHVDLNRLISEILKDIEMRLTDTNGKVDRENLPIVYADPSQMRQLFQNLLVNALKFRKKEVPPRVLIRAAPGEEGFCEISVSDNGIGFDQKYLEQIFKPFSRLHSYFEYEGSGIGLAICQKIILRHGGHISAQSRPGEGADFIFTLPLEEGEKR